MMSNILSTFLIVYSSATEDSGMSSGEGDIFHKWSKLKPGKKLKRSINLKLEIVYA